MRVPLSSSPAAFALLYALGAGAWIVLSDLALAAIAADRPAIERLGTYKGLAFVAVSTLLLWTILRRHRARLDDEIAASVRARASSREAEERLRVVTQAANVGLWDWDVRTGRVLYSPEWKRQIGYDADELSDDFIEWQSRVHPDDLRGALGNVRRHLEGDSAHFDNLFRFRHRDGSYRWILVQSAIERDAAGRATRVRGSHIDITERKQAEEDLRGQEVALALAREAGNLGVWRYDRQTGALALDDRARSHYGVDHDPTGAELLQRVPEEDRTRILGRMDEVARSGGPGRVDIEHRIVDADGQERWLSVHAQLVFDGAGPDRRPLQAFGTSQDVTDRKRAEQALRDSEERLRQAQKMEAIGQLAGGVAHDFNNILVVIQGHADLMRMQPALPPSLRESCDEIARAAERASALTRQLLVFSRRQVMQRRELDLRAVVADTATMLRRVLGENVELVVRDHPVPLPVLADRGMLELVLLNLAVNARDAMPDGGTLEVETRAVAADGRRCACLEVRDHGRGIPPDVLPRIFEPFFTTKEVGKGTGLGLATAFGVVREHGGIIEVESEAGRGATFRVQLPIADEEAPLELPPARPEARGGSETLLLVEDDASVRALIVDLLSRLGYVVLQATTGVEALALATTYQGPVALVITDLVMPGGISGFELGRRLATVRPQAAIVYTSGFSTELAGSQVELVEGVNFLPKPFSPVALAHIVRERLDRARSVAG